MVQPSQPSAQPSKPARPAKARHTMPKRVGNFEIVSHIATGGMGHVYLGRHVFLGKPAAIKVLRRELPNRAALVDMLRQEARSLARLDHPNVVQVIDIGQHDGTDFIAMDHASGVNLATLIRKRGALEPDLVHRIAWQMLSGIGAAHQAGVLHRDIKPDNVIVDASGVVKITDFGLAGDIRMVAAGYQRQRHATPAYAAPEVLRGWRSDVQSDLFSLAATLYHAATGLLPFGAASRSSVLAAQKAGTQHIAELAPGLSPALARAVMAALASEAEDRPASAADMLLLAFPTGAPRARRLRPWMALTGVAAAASLVAAVLLVAGGVFTPRVDPRREEIGTNAVTTGPEEQPAQANPGALPTVAMGSLLLEAREERARRALAAISESLGPALMAAPDSQAVAALSAFAGRHEGTAASREARDRLAQATKSRLAAFDRTLASLEEAEPVRALDALAAMEAELRTLTPRPTQEWLDAWGEVRAGFQRKLSAELDTVLAAADALAATGRPDLALQRVSEFAGSEAFLHLTPADVARIAASRGAHESTLAAATTAESERAAATRKAFVLDRGQAAARTLDALRPLISGATTGQLGKLVTALDAMATGLPAHDRPAAELALTSTRKAHLALDWMAASLRGAKDGKATLRVLLPDGGGERTGDCTVVSVDGHMLTVAGLAGLPRSEVWVHDLHPAMWMDRIDLLSPSARSTHYGNLAHWLSFRVHPSTMNQLVALVPAEDAWVTSATRPLEPLVQQLALQRATALLLDGRTIPADIEAIGYGRAGDLVLAATRTMIAEGKAPPSFVAAALFADGLTGVPAGLHNPVLSAWLLPRIPGGLDLALVLQSQIPTDPLAAIMVGDAMLAGRVDPEGNLASSLRAAITANPLNPALAPIAGKLGIK